jgi:SPP1 gp7 family putative phage head morphogenesis protein
MSAHYMSDEQFNLAQQTAADNPTAWKKSGVVKTLKYYSAEDADVCAICRAHHGAVVNISEAAIGANLPPLPACSSRACRQLS